MDINVFTERVFFSREDAFFYNIHDKQIHLSFDTRKIVFIAWFKGKYLTYEALNRNIFKWKSKE